MTGNNILTGAFHNKGVALTALFLMELKGQVSGSRR